MFRGEKQNGFLQIAALILIFALLSGCASAPRSVYHVEGAADSAPAVDYKPTLSYQMLLSGIKASGYKKIYAGDAETVIKRAQKYNNGLKQRPPNDFYRRFIVAETAVQGRPCFLITPKQNARTDTVVVFLYGGAFLLDIDFYHWNAIERLLDELSAPVYVPLYPIYPETSPDAALAFIREAFERIYAAYPEARIIGLGDSSGACLLLNYCHYLSKTDAPRFPDQLILVSPAQVMGIDDATLNAMKAIARFDVGISINILENLPAIFNMNDDSQKWFNTPLYGDFSRFPPITVFSGTHEIFHPLMQPFVERVRVQGKPIELYAGIKMMHDWPYMPIASESKHALAKILEIIAAVPEYQILEQLP